MMDEQFDPMNEQPNEGLTTRDIVSASRRKDVGPDTRQTDAGRPDSSRPARSAAPSARRDREAAEEQRGRADTSPMPPMPLLSDAETDAFEARWDAIQTAFVDEPRQVVEQADSLVAEVMRQLAETFAQERASLERQWARGGNVSTEDLRIALQRYRSFFQRLLSA